MGEVFSFGAEERASLLERLSQRERPSWLRIVLHGDARALAGEIGLRVWQGRVVDGTPAQLTVPRLLVRMAFARAGRVEVRPDEGPEPDLRTALPIRRALLEAEQAARALEALLAPLGGPTVVVVTRPDRVVRAAAQLGRVALEIANQLLDQPRTVGEVLARGADDVATARALDQLRDLGVLEVSVSQAEGSIPPPVTSGASGRPGVRSRPPTLRSRAPKRARVLEVPEPADDDEAELELVLSEAPEMRARERSPAPPVEPISVVTHAARVPASPAADSGETITVNIADTRRAEAAAARRVEAAAAPEPPQDARARSARGAPDVDPRDPPRRDDRSAGRDVEDDEAEARSSPTPWLIALGIVVLLLAILWWWQRTPETPPPPPPPQAVVDPPPPSPPPPPPRPVTTVEPSAYSLSRPPPLAGPEADRRLREAERLIQAGRYDEAEAILAPLRESRAEDPLVWLLTGTLEIERGRFGEAAAAIDRAITIDPKSYRGYILRGSIQQFQGSGRAAVQSYRAALGISPAHPMSPELREVTDRLQADLD